MNFKFNSVLTVLSAAAIGVAIDSIFDIRGPAPLGRSITIGVVIVAAIWILWRFFNLISSCKSSKNSTDLKSDK